MIQFYTYVLSHGPNSNFNNYFKCIFTTFIFETTKWIALQILVVSKTQIYNNIYIIYGSLNINLNNKYIIENEICVKENIDPSGRGERDPESLEYKHVVYGQSFS